MANGRLIGLGVGPGDPELITVKALRLLQAAPVIAYYVAPGKSSHALTIVTSYLRATQQQVPLVYPVTGQIPPPPFDYEQVMREFYDTAAGQIAEFLTAGSDVAVLCEGDPFFYGSFMYLHDRLAHRFPTDVVPGVCSVLASAAVAGYPLVYRNQTLSILAATLPEAELEQHLAHVQAAAIMKLGHHIRKVRRILTRLGLVEKALYVERATMSGQRIEPLQQLEIETVPYFSMILLPGPRWHCVS
jgi:precorrin-2 C(20)-methyltransferase